ncbi:hypothetical protein ACWOFR_04440 [Carnobacterium gallinarum]|uniref:hypothetical protein n=1 Tax=Carnobacterium gallinarum TaxID=2749 RepID=UPI0005528DFE|nr:hypothetical protein [Carnobacterium gallinarum]
MFSLTSRFYRFCEVVMRLFCLNVLFILFSIPLVTLGGSFTALVVGVKQMDQPIVANFSANFRKSWLRSLPLVAFSIVSILFLISFNNLLQGVPGNVVIRLVMQSFVLVYNVNNYSLLGFTDGRGLDLFRSSFYFTLGTFHKTFFFPVVIVGCVWLGTLPIGVVAALFLFSGLMWFYLKLVQKELKLVIVEKNIDSTLDVV